MVKNNKKRVMITLPKRQLEWAEKFAKEHGKTLSKFISYMLAHRADEMINFFEIDGNNYTKEELQEIINTKWVEDE